jgi:hypothetical protein
MDAYDRYTNLEKKILLIILPSMVEAENLSDHPRIIFKSSLILLVPRPTNSIKKKTPCTGSEACGKKL